MAASSGGGDRGSVSGDIGYNLTGNWVSSEYVIGNTCPFGECYEGEFQTRIEQKGNSIDATKHGITRYGQIAGNKITISLPGDYDWYDGPQADIVELNMLDNSTLEGRRTWTLYGQMNCTVAWSIRIRRQ